MKNRKWLFTALLSLFSGMALAQHPAGCFTEQHAQEMQARFPEQAARKAMMEQQIQQYISQQQNLRTNGAVIQIPVVIHVVSEKGCNSISKAQILNGLEVVNQDFRRQNPDTVNTRAIFKPFAADTEIEFVLARLDPQGNPTDGINRVTSPTANAPRNQNDVKLAVPAWPTNKYFNIWLVDRIYDTNSGTDNLQGYAQFPQFPSPNTYGVVLVNHQWGKQFAVSGTTAISSGHYATHEIAHCFHLLHTEGTNCNDADGLADTPPAMFSGLPFLTCNLNRNSCTSDAFPDQVENFMSFSDLFCKNMFTHGQKNRMHATIATTPFLQNLVSSSNALSTGIDPSVTVGTVAPKPYFCADTRRICAGGSVNFTDVTFQTPGATRSWSFPGGTPATSTVQQPMVTYSTPGKYAVTLTLNHGGNSYPVTITDYIEVLPVTNLINVSFPGYYIESFEEPTFPASATANRHWEMKTSSVDATPQNWLRTNASAGTISYTSSNSLVLKNAIIPEGTVSTLITPNFTGGAPEVFFEMAYAKRVAQPKDELRVFISHDCGATWGTPVLTLTGNQLITNGGANASGNYIPASSDWQLVNINLSSINQNIAN